MQKLIDFSSYTVFFQQHFKKCVQFTLMYFHRDSTTDPETFNVSEQQYVLKCDLHYDGWLIKACYSMPFNVGQ